MQRSITRGATRLSLLGLLGLVVAATISLLLAHTTFADNRGPWNGAEVEAMSLCGTDRRGAIWFTNSGGYYGDTVVVEGSDGRNDVPVGIRGSVYSCATGGTAHTGAVGVRPDGPNAWRLNNLTSSTLDRGVVSGARNWSSQGGQIDATLNISGLATNNNGRDDSATIQIGIYRCFYNFGTGAQGLCYTQIINVTVIRKAKPIVWSLSGSSTVRKGSSASSTSITAAPGNRLTWTHQLRNNGPNATNANVWSNVGMSGFTNGWGSGLSEAVTGPGAGVGIIRSGFGYNVYDVTQNDVGRSLCQWVQFDPTNTSGGRNGRGNQACASIPYNYTLTPTISLNRNEVEVGGQVGVTGTVNNSGPTKSKTATWQFSYVTIDPGSNNVPVAGFSASNTTPCDYYRGTSRTCQTTPALTFASGGAGNGSQVFNPGSVGFSRTANVVDLPVGTQVCYAISVKDAGANDGRWSHSAARCAYVAKRPLVQVIGGDLIVGRGGATSSIVSTNTKISSGQKFGSWSEYGIAASGLITGMASASGYAGGTTVTNLCGVSFLSFSNKVGTSACADNRIGQYSFKVAASTIAGRFPTSSAETISGSRGIDTLASGRTYTGTGTITLTAPANYRVEAGKWVVINAPNATVNIDNNILYTNGALTSVAQIPQVVIIAQNIVIADRVTQVDAWLVATGTGANGNVNTCRQTSTDDVLNDFTDLTSGVCKDRLQVNGPVIANHLYLRRTAGAGTGEASGEPAEVFNLRPDAYLWASNLQTGTAKAQTVLTTELPPRY